MDFSDLKTRVTEYLERGDTNIATKVGNWINDTRKDIANKYTFGYLLTEAYVGLTSGTARYALPTDYLGKLEVFLVNKSDSKKRAKLDKMQSARYFADTYLDDAESGHSTVVDGGTPNKYVEYGTEFEVHPTPNSSAASDYRLYIWYYAQPTNFSDDSDEDHISRYHFEAIIFGAVYRGALYFDDQYKKEEFKGLYREAIVEMIHKEKKMDTQDLHPRMKHWQDYTASQMRRKMGVLTNLDDS